MRLTTSAQHAWGAAPSLGKGAFVSKAGGTKVLLRWFVLLLVCGTSMAWGAETLTQAASAPTLSDYANVTSQVPQSSVSTLRALAEHLLSGASRVVLGGTTDAPQFLNDQSTVHLASIFGPVGALLPGASSSMMGSIFKWLNMGFLLMTVGLASFSMSMTVVNTAREGTPLGRQAGTAWFPLRLFMGAGALAPLPGGYCVVQVAVMWAVLHGVQLANALWLGIDGYLKVSPSINAIFDPSSRSSQEQTDDQVLAGQTIRYTVPGMTEPVTLQAASFRHGIDLATTALKSRLCYQFLASQQQQQANDNQAAAASLQPSHPTVLPPPDPTVRRGFVPGANMVVNHDTQRVSYTGPMSNCGGFSLQDVPGDPQWFPKNSTGRQQFLKQRFDAFLGMLRSLDGVAKRVLACRTAQKNLGKDMTCTLTDAGEPIPPEAGACNVCSTQTQALTDVLKAAAMYTYRTYQAVLSNQKLPGRQAHTLGTGGWATLGYYYRTLTSALQDRGVERYAFTLEPATNLTTFQARNQTLAPLFAWVGVVSSQRQFSNDHNDYSTHSSFANINPAGLWHLTKNGLKKLKNAVLGEGGGSAEVGITYNGTLNTQANQQSATLYSYLIRSVIKATGAPSEAALKQAVQAQRQRDKALHHVFMCSLLIPQIPVVGWFVHAPSDCPSKERVGVLDVVGALGDMKATLSPVTAGDQNINQDIEVFLYQLAAAWNEAFEEGRGEVLSRFNLYGVRLLSASVNLITSLSQDIFARGAKSSMYYLGRSFGFAMAAAMLQAAQMGLLQAAKYAKDIPLFGDILALILKILSLLPAIAKGPFSGLAAQQSLSYRLDIFLSTLYVPVAMAAAIPVMVYGLLFAFYVPIVPFLMFTLCVVGWLISVIEAMLAAPLVAMGVTNPYGHDFLGRAEMSLMLVLSLVLRPSLIVLGFVAGIVVFHVSFWMAKMMFDYTLLGVFKTLFNGGTSSSQWGVYAYCLFSVMLIGYIALALVNQSFSLMYLLPSKLMRWLGVPADEPLEAQAMAVIREDTQEAFGRLAQGSGSPVERTSGSASQTQINRIM